MRLLHGLDALRKSAPRAVMTIGNFDGIHLGHRRLLDACRAQAGAVSPDNPIVVVTFEPHPLTVLRPAAVPPRLTSQETKLQLLESLGVSACILLKPEPAVLNLSAEDFWAILRDEARPRVLIEGPEFNFGRGRLGTAKKLAEWAAGTDVAFEQIAAETCALLDLRLVEVSSTLIRWLVSHGRLRDAAICLGRPHLLRGRVIHGQARGRELGVRTANLDCGNLCIPCDGVYAARCRVDGQTYAAAVSIGDLPTFGPGPRQIEAHLIGFEGDLYDRILEVELLDWLREQRKFSSPCALVRAIGEDLEQTRRRSAMDPAQPIAALG